MKNQKISVKITLGFAVVILLMIVCTIVVTISNTITVQNLYSINAASTFQTLGTNLSNAFHEARLNSKIIIISPNDESYMEITKYLKLCDDIIHQMKEHIKNNPTLEKFSQSPYDVEEIISRYSTAIDNLQASNTTLRNTEIIIMDTGEALTKLSDSMDEKHISDLYASTSSDMSTAKEHSS